MPPGRPRWPPTETRPSIEGFGPLRFDWWALSGGLLPGFHSVERGTGKTPGRTDPLEAVGQTRAGRGGGTHRRDLRRPKGPDVSVLVEGFFATLSKRRLKRGIFHSVLDLNLAIRDYIEAHNADPKPFVWTAHADTIIAKVNRGKHLLESIH